MKKRFTLPAVAFLILLRDGKVLLKRRQGSGWCDGYYDAPAGHIEGGESLTQAMSREAKEELGIDVNPSDMKFTSASHSYFDQDKVEYIYVFYETTKWQGEPQNCEPHKCDDLAWFDLNNLPDKLTPATTEGLKAYLEGASYYERGF